MYNKFKANIGEIPPEEIADFKIHQNVVNF